MTGNLINAHKFQTEDLSKYRKKVFLSMIISNLSLFLSLPGGGGDWAQLCPDEGHP